MWHTVSNDVLSKIHWQASLYRCAAEGLQELYSSPQVQVFLNCLPVKDVLENKRIYQAGCLRKVSTLCNGQPSL